jgi:hypothetical protein
VRVLGEGATLSLYVSRISFLHSSHLKVETEMNQFPFFATAFTLKGQDLRSAIGLKVSPHCSALDSAIASYVRIRTEFRLATGTRFTPPSFFSRARHLPH